MAKILAVLELSMDGLDVDTDEETGVVRMSQVIEVPDDVVDSDGEPTDDAIEHVEDWMLDHIERKALKTP
jgi:hypothetical protein